MMTLLKESSTLSKGRFSQTEVSGNLDVVACVSVLGDEIDLELSASALASIAIPCLHHTDADGHSPHAQLVENNVFNKVTFVELSVVEVRVPESDIGDAVLGETVEIALALNVVALRARLDAPRGLLPPTIFLAAEARLPSIGSRLAQDRRIVFHGRSSLRCAYLRRPQISRKLRLKRYSADL